MRGQKHIAIYLRVSSKQQDHRSQLPDLESWARANQNGVPIKFYADKASGKTMKRPQWNALEEQIRLGRVKTIVVWRLDRLGRTASGLTALFDELQQRGVNLVSLKDGLDLSTPAGRLMANVLASVAQFESEIRGERIRAGQAVARANGKRWGGSEKGRRWKVTDDQVALIHQKHLEGMPKTRIAAAIGVSVPTIYNILDNIPWSTSLPKAVK